MTKSSVSSSEASKRTLSRRTSEMNTHLSVATGGGEVAQMRHAVKSLTSEDRKDLLGDFQIEIPALTGLAMKADMCLPWNRMRTMKR